MRVLVILAVVVAVGFALAWWSSGRSRPVGRGGDSARLDGENRAMRQYSPKDGGFSGGGGV